MVEPPTIIQNDPDKLRRWNEITADVTVTADAVPLLSTLVYWYSIQEQCLKDINADDGIHVAYMNDQGDVKAMPQIDVLKKASAEIRALEKILNLERKPVVQSQNRTLSAFEEAKKRRESKLVDLSKVRRRKNGTFGS